MPVPVHAIATRRLRVGLLLGALLLPLSSAAAEPPAFDVTAHGAVLSDDQPDDDAWSKCLQAAIAAGGVCRIGPGTLTLTKYPAELRQSGTITANRDLNGLIIEGSGEDQTTVHGTSAKGFDVFQLNAVSHLTIRNLTITSVKTTDDQTQGVNGVSLTNGSANVTIEQVTVRKLPFVLMTGRFDGGKAFTVQQGALGAASSTDIEIRDCSVFDTPIGFGLDADPNQMVLPGRMAIRGCRFQNVSLGFSLSFSEKKTPGDKLPGFGLEITGNELVDVTRVLLISRAPDVVFTGNTVKTERLSDLPDPLAHPGIPLAIVGGPRAKIEHNSIDYQPKVAAFVVIGSARGGPNSDTLSLSDNTFTGPADVGVQALNDGVINSRFAGNTFSGARRDRDPRLGDRRLKNAWTAKRMPRP
uniref:Right-handed parallel beta-helix repeat-containing protein n=1 Tax=Schlesneria paludicola TaxID=360056 RepID=A0A7C2NVI3_9PLAN